MTRWVALLRAVNVGGTGKLAMADLRRICAEAGMIDPRTWVASGNVVFESALGEGALRSLLEARLAAHMGGATRVFVRAGEALRALAADNPFPDAPGNRVTVLFTDAPLPDDPMAGVAGRADEVIRAGTRALYVHYPGGMAKSRLRIPAEQTGTMRNMNTVAALAAMAAAKG